MNTPRRASRAVFSSSSDEIVDVVEADVNLYQSKVRPTLADFLHLPRWLARLNCALPDVRHLR